MSAFEFMGSRRRSLAATALAGLAAGLEAMLGALRARHELRVSARRLRSLSDWQLRDIGLRRDRLAHLVDGLALYRSRRDHALD